MEYPLVGWPRVVHAHNYEIIAQLRNNRGFRGMYSVFKLISSGMRAPGADMSAHGGWGVLAHVPGESLARTNHFAVAQGCARGRGVPQAGQLEMYRVFGASRGEIELDITDPLIQNSRIGYNLTIMYSRKSLPNGFTIRSLIKIPLLATSHA